MKKGNNINKVISNSPINVESGNFLCIRFLMILRFLYKPFKTPRISRSGIAIKKTNQVMTQLHSKTNKLVIIFSKIKASYCWLINFYIWRDRIYLVAMISICSLILSG